MPHPIAAGEYLQRQLVDQTGRVLALARRAGVQRAVVLGSYFATWHRMRPDLDLASKHSDVQARLDQAEVAIDTGAGRVVGGMDVSVLEIPFVFGTVPGRVPMRKEWLFGRIAAVPMAMHPCQSSSAVTALQVGQAAAGALEAGIVRMGRPAGLSRAAPTPGRCSRSSRPARRRTPRPTAARSALR
ncbi:hypothetical protein [Aestuariimicrobium ganziense]|uniref:hypothetical protein n=1 Tax=Aestuariimicrobium ganziense TaxID=2773677 RepID=UPI0019450B96|nr:hypothetical protein [Aestuariimicrobium ganziense]